MDSTFYNLDNIMNISHNSINVDNFLDIYNLDRLIQLH
jgi:hypothetical protein